MDDDFLPDGPPEAVSEVVNFIHDDVAQMLQQVRIGVEHVSQHFGGHNDDASLGVDGRVPGEKTDLACAVGVHQFAVFLV